MARDRISPHFLYEEFACHCACGFNKVNPALIFALEAVREHFGVIVHVNSGCRCEQYNIAVGGERNSQHVKGNAADIVVSGIAPAVVAEYCDGLIGDRGGVGRYGTFTHIDVRGSQARWDYMKQPADPVIK